MAEATDTTVNGVTLAEFAFLRAGLADGLALDELLAFRRLHAATWEAAEDAWDDRVLDAMVDDPALLDEIDAEMAEARTHWTRRIPPLDEDLRAWFAFLNAWKSDPDPIAFLGRMRLEAPDLAYLHRVWSERMAKDADLRKQAMEMLCDELGEPPVPSPEPPKLLRARAPASADEGGTQDLMPTKLHTLPFAEGDAAPMPPPLAVPLPRRPRPRTTAPGLDETRLGGAKALAAPLPFVEPEEAAAAPPVGAEVAGEREPAAPPKGLLPASPLEPAASPLPPPARPAPPARDRLGAATLVLPVARETTLVLAPALPAGDADPKLDETKAIVAATGKAIPFADAFADLPSDAYRPVLTLEQHAELTAEVTLGAALADVLARYGLTPDARHAEDEHWTKQFERDPLARPKWLRACAAARARLAAAGEKS
jgi:hypothetical protein